MSNKQLYKKIICQLNTGRNEGDPCQTDLTIGSVLPSIGASDNIKKAWVVHNFNGYDELTTVSKNKVVEINNNRISEIQIIDPSVYEKPQDVLGGDIELNNVLTDLEEKKHFLGSVNDLFSPVSNFSYNPVGEWNNYFIRIDQGNNLGSVKLNGIIINEFPLKGPEWNSALSKSKFNNSNEYPYLGDKRWYDFGKFSEGFICFQDHPGKAYFKNIKIRELR